MSSEWVLLRSKRQEQCGLGRNWSRKASSFHRRFHPDILLLYNQLTAIFTVFWDREYGKP